ncbi:response regulator transcription factor [Streptomyces sp. NPDC050804]|uniref:response regulator transcription factor n=1 Tax=Streptomyces sp. NPDC050804 TaxID=3154745 RepID=UPI00342B3EDB
MAAVGAFSERHPIRVFLVDGHEAVRQGLGDLLDAEPDMITVGTADSVEQSLVRVPVTHPDVAVVNVRLTEDIVSCRALRSAEPALSLLTLASFDDDTAHLHAVLAGASGSVLRQIRGTRLAFAVRSAAAGHSTLDRTATARLLEGLALEGRDHRTNGLSARERHLMVLIGDRLTDRQIGRRLFLSEESVRAQIARLLTGGVPRRHGLPSALPPRRSVPPL